MTHRLDWRMFICYIMLGMILLETGHADIDKWSGGGPSNGQVTALAVSSIDASIIYAGVSRAGLYKSNNSGTTWTTTMLTAPGIRQIVVDPLTPAMVYVLYAGEMVKSLDGGTNWSSNLSPSTYGQVLDIDPLNTSTLYLGTRYGIYKSTDGGLSWIARSQGLTSFDVTSMAIHPANPSVLYITTREQGVFRTDNAAETWIQSGLPNKVTYSIAFDRQAAPHIYAATSEEIFVSTDDGKSWKETNMPSGNSLVIAADQSQSDVIYVAKPGSGVFKANTNSHLWSYTNKGLEDLEVTSLAVNGNTVYVGTNGNGVFRTDNSGDTWQSTALLNVAADVRALAAVPGNSNILYAGTIKDGIFKSIDKGATWKYLASSPMRMFDIHMLVVDPTNPSTIYVAGDNLGLYVSRNDGSTWSPINNRLSNNHIRAMAVFPAIASTLIVGTENGVYRSVNNGGTWESKLLGQSVSTLVVEDVNTNIAYLGTTQTGLYKTFDRGVAWQSLNGPSASISALAVKGEVIIVGTPEQGIFKSVDAGITWAASSTAFAGIRINTLNIDRNNPSLIFAATSAGVFYSTNAGDNWLPMAVDQPMSTQGLVIDSIVGTTVHTGTLSSGVQSYTFSQLSIPSQVSAPAIAREADTSNNSGEGGGGIIALLSLQAMLFTMLLRLRI